MKEASRISLSEEEPSISIIVPVYNVENELDRCVESLIHQTFCDIEIILVDDGSKDSSGAMCDAWKRRDSRIVTIHKTNGGLSSARNAGISVSKGEYIGFVDSDDYVEPEMYSMLYSAAIRTGADLVCCGRFVHTGIELQTRFVAAQDQIITRDNAIREVLIGERIDVSAWDKLYRKELFNNIRYPEGRISEDVAIILPLLYKVNKVAYVSKPLYHYVFRSGSISKARYSHVKFDVMTNCMEMKAFANAYLPMLEACIDSFCCTQAAAMIEDIINTPKGRSKYQDDYGAFWKLFRETYPAYRSFDSHNRKEFIRIVLTRVHLYRLFWILRMIRNGVKRHG